MKETSATPTECAQEILEVVPLILRAMRAEMRREPRLDLSLPQFRALTTLSRMEGPSLSDLARCLGLSLPSTSKVVDSLVARRLVSRQQDPRNRRRLTLGLTPEGQQTLSRVRAATLEEFSRSLRVASAEDRQAILRAMGVLREAFPNSPRNLVLSESGTSASP
jgi:DNA-binding MarR family transcriptional regulator